METLTEKNFQRDEGDTQPRVQTVKFTNFSSEDFTWTWNNVPYTFKAGEFKFMQESLAKHFAKHLINRELLKDGRENDTSPRNPEENHFFMEKFRKCVEYLNADGDMDETKAEQEAIDRNMKAELGLSSDVDSKPKKGGKKAKQVEEKKDEEFEEIEVPDDEK